MKHPGTQFSIQDSSREHEASRDTFVVQDSSREQEASRDTVLRTAAGNMRHPGNTDAEVDLKN